MKLKVEIDGKIHKVVYIEYWDGIPHEVTTQVMHKEKTKFMVLYHWDFFANGGDKDDLKAYNSGSGGYDWNKGLYAPNWVSCGTYWISDDFKFDGTPINGKKLKHPKILSSLGRKSRNPFTVAWITYSREYCLRCGEESTDYCREHIHEDNEGQLRYNDDDSLVD